MNKILVALLFFSMVSPAVAQKAIDVQNHDGVKKYFGIDQEKLSPETWKGNWIWREGEIIAKNAMISARKTFNLNQKPEESLLYITADNHYTLWVNGEYINRGPARSAAHHQSYDILDISSKLKKGNNVIAVRVHHLGTIVSYIDEVRPGLLFQLEIPTSEGTIFIVSDEKVKVRKETGWDTQTPQLKQQQQAHVENFDYRQSILNWEQLDFDDTEWENAELLQPIGLWPPKQSNDTEFARMAPWYTLVPRDLPYLKDELRPVKSVFETGESAEFHITGRGGVVQQLPILGVMQHQIQPLKHSKVENLNDFIQGKGDLTIQNSYPKSLYSDEPIRSTWIVFDMEELLMGYPTLEIEGERGTMVNITYAPFLIDGKYNPAIMAENYGDRITLPGRKVFWQAQELRTFRYIGFLISGTEEPVTISWAGVRQTYYPFEEKPAIKLGDSFLEKLSDASRKTIKVITHDAYTDNYQERRQYIQTAWYAARGNYSLFGDPYLMRRCLIQHAQDQHPNGIFPMFSPGIPFAGIMDSDLFWHMGLYDYFMFTGDRKTTKKLLLNLKRNLLALEDLENQNGLLESPPYAYWIDHINLDRRGINFTLNGWYMMALEKDAKLFHYFGMKEEAEKYKQKADNIRQYLKNRFWNNEKGLFVQSEVNGEQSHLYDEISNGLALVTGIADEDQVKSIAEKIINNDKTREMVRPVIMMYWPIEGLFSAGYGEEAIQLLKKRYEVMMQHEEGTLWESWNLYATENRQGKFIPRTRSSAQAEQVYHPDVFQRHLLGVEILQPGMKEIKISFNDYGLKIMEGTIPTPHGNIKIAWNLEEKEGNLDVSYPNMINVVINKHNLPAGIIINHEKY